MTKTALRMLLVAVAFIGTSHAQERALPDPEELVALLRGEKYAELDARLGAYQAAYEANTNAEWALIVAIAAFERVDPELEARHAAWIKAHPGSYVARLARAAYNHQRAWSSRGGGFSSETAAERFEAMRKHFHLSHLDLVASLGMSPRPQLSLKYLISAGMARSDRAQIDKAQATALKFDPENYASHRAFLNAYRPEWGGSIDQMSKIVAAAESAPQTPKKAAVVKYLKASLLGYHALQAERAKQYPAALDFYAKGLAETEDAILLARRGRLLNQLNRLDEALRDFDRALALDPNSTDALAGRGNIREQRKQNKEAAADYARAGSYGSTYAMRRLGMMYLNGAPGVPINDAQALRWLSLGAELGEPTAQMALGYMYSNARGVPQDPRKAYDLWRASAAQGDQQAQEYLDDVPWYWKLRFAVEDLFR